jgi:hypothetical protein
MSHRSLLATDAERALVASLLFDPERIADVAPVVRPADLADPMLGVVLGVLLERHASGEPVELPAVVAAVRQRTPDERDAKDLLVSLSGEAVSGLHAASYARDVAAAAERRRLRDALREGARLVERGIDAGEVRSLVERSAPADGQQAEATPEWRPFPTHTLPEPLRSLVVEGAASIGCDESFVALPGLAVAAGTIGGTRVLRLKRDWTEPAILWCVVVSPSGATKSQGRKLVLDPLWRREREELLKHQAATVEFGVLSAMHDRAMSQWKKCPSHGPAPQPPVKPELIELTLSDTTVEGAARALQRNPRGLLVECDELAAWFKSFNLYRDGADAQHWMMMHGGGRLKVNRAGLAEPMYIDLACASVSGTVQPAILTQCLGREHQESGLAARLLFANPPRRAKRWTDEEVAEQTTRAWAQRLTALLDLRFAIPAQDETPEDDAPGDSPLLPIDCRLSADAHRRWVAFVNQHGAEGLERDGAELAAWSKLEGYAARLALVLHLIADPHAVEVSLDTLERALELMGWFAGEAERFYRGARIDPKRALDEKVAAWIATRRGGEATPREVLAGVRGVKTAAEAQTTMQRLVERDRAQWIDPPAGSPTKTRTLRLKENSAPENAVWENLARAA